MSTPAAYRWTTVPLALLIACAPEDDGPAASFAEGCILDTAAVCDDCLVLEHEFRIGSVDGPGFLAGGEGGRIVRDGSGQYWISQRERMNVYGPGGEFIRTVGREGEGPMEFQRAHPFHADAAGNVHVRDPLNLRVTIISPEFALVDEEPLSGRQINDMIAIDDAPSRIPDRGLVPCGPASRKPCRTRSRKHAI